MNALNFINERTGTVSRSLNGLAAAWLILIAVLICADVIGRSVFGQPVVGVDEIVANSLVAVLFLQLPLTVFDKAMIRTTMFYDNMPLVARKLVDSLVCVMGIVLFFAIAKGAFPDMLMGWEIGETEGSGALEVPVYPTRTIIVAMASFTALIYGLLLLRVWSVDHD